MNNRFHDSESLTNIPAGLKLIVRPRRDGGTEYIMRRDDDIENIAGGSNWFIWFLVCLFALYLFGSSTPSVQATKSAKQEQVNRETGQRKSF